MVGTGSYICGAINDRHLPNRHMNTLAAALGIYWIPVRDGDCRVSAIYRRHYSCYQYADNRRDNPNYPNRHLVMGPGEKLVLLGADCKAIFGWRKFIDDSGQRGVNCSFFRNEGALQGDILSSELILRAEKLAFAKWGNQRLYTYINTSIVRGDGYCFKMAGWTKLNKRTKVKNLLILEKVL